jgi:hypothetical protein
LIVQIPPDQTETVLWNAARDTGTQIRFLRPRRGTLEEIFLKAVEEAD